jgi:hypothetical protein
MINTKAFLSQRTGMDLNMIQGFVVHGFHYHICENKEYHEALLMLVSVVFAKKDAPNTTWRIALIAGAWLFLL